jgi:D-amino-acid oxidase
MGLKTQRSEIKVISDVFQLPLCEHALGIVNCTGLSARKLVPDNTVYPTKGQVVIVQGEAERVSMILGGKLDAYVIPRPGSGTTVLGGCKLAGDW